MIRIRNLPILTVAVLGLALVAGLFTAFAPPLAAQGGSGRPAPAQPQDPNEYWGAKFFDDAIRYVAKGQQGIPAVQTFYVDLDAKLELDATRHQGRIRMWFQAPSMYRQDLTTNNATTSKILAGDMGWIKTPNGRVQNLALSAEGARTIAQLREDRDRLTDLTKFLTLQTLKGPGVKFVFDGYKEGSGTYAGNWIKITRKVAGRSNISFWLAYTRQGNTVTATWPGIVRVEGDPARGYPTEDYILQEWDSPRSQARAFRYPRKIDAYSLIVGRDGRSTPTRFLQATMDDIKINVPVDPSRFRAN